MYVQMTSNQRLDVDKLVEYLQDYCEKNVVLNYYSSEVVAEGKRLNESVHRIKSKTCCQTHLETDVLCQLEYWDELTRLIRTRIASINRETRMETSCCENYSTIRFLNTGLPIMVYPSRSTTIVQQMTLFLLFLSGVLQFIRVQIDGSLSFWAQVVYSVGCVFSLTYYMWIKNIQMVVPQVGALLLSLVTLWGLLRNVDTPWASL